MTARALASAGRALALYYSDARKPLAIVVPDKRYPRLWRALLPGGAVSDLTNLNRAADAAFALMQRRRDWRLLRWRPHHSDAQLEGRRRAQTLPPLWGVTRRANGHASKFPAATPATSAGAAL
jgi:hypothetical protein